MKQQGFTLIEILITLSILFIFTAISLPDLNKLFSENQSMILQKQLVQAIRFAHEQARIREVEVGLKIDKNKLIIFLDKNHNGVISQSVQIIRVVQINLQNNFLSWRAFPHYRQYVLFTPGLAVTSDNGTFWYCYAGEKVPVWAISVSASALLRIIYPENGGIKDSQGNFLNCKFIKNNNK